jgi:hypothetical protein
MQLLDVFFFGLLNSAYNRECGLFVRSPPHEQTFMEDIPALFRTAYKNISVVAKCLSGFPERGIYSLNSDVINEEDLISGKGPSAVATTMEVDGSSRSRGGIDSSHEKDGFDAC